MDAYKNLSLTGKVAIITGSSSGIGAATAILMSKRGAQVVLTGRNTTKLAKVEDQCIQASPEKLKPLVVVGDITSKDVRKELISKTVEKFGRLDILVNNAGYANFGTILDVKLEDLDKMLDVHVRAPFDLTSLGLPHLLSTKGSVVNVSSVAGIRSLTNNVCYGIAKSAQDQLTRCCAVDLGAKGVRVNSVNPGGVKTDIGEGLSLTPEKLAEFMDNVKIIHAQERVAESEEIAEVIAFLSSEAASFMTGANVLVDGGCAPMLRMPS